MLLGVDLKILLGVDFKNLFGGDLEIFFGDFVVGNEGFFGWCGGFNV